MRLTLLLLIVLVSCVSCKKSFCWKCAITDRYIYQNQTETDHTRNIEVCNKTEDQMKEYTKVKETTSTDGSYRIITTGSCQKE